MADMEASIKLTADMTAVEKQLADIIARFESLTGHSLPAAKAGLTEAEAATNKFNDSVVKSKTELTGMAGALEAANRAASGLGTTMELVGAESAGGAQKIRLMNEAIKELSAASGPLLAVVVAMEALSKAFEFIKDGVDDAAKLQRSMEQLRGVVEASGGDWKEAKEHIEDFLTSESMASGFTKDQLAPILQDLAARFGDVNSAMAATGVAEEVARGTGMDLATTEQELTGLLGGRLGMLAKLDPKLKEMIANHASERDILIELHKHYQNAIKDQNDLATEQDRLHIAMQEVSEKIGTALLPVLTELVKILAGVFEAAGSTFNAFIQFGHGIYELVAGPIAAGIHGFMALWDAVHGNAKGAASEGKQALDGLKEGLQGVVDMGEGAFKALWDTSLPGFITNTINGVSDFQGQIDKATKKHNDDLAKRLQDFSDAPTGKTKSGKSGGSGSGGTITEQLDGQLSISHDALADSQKKLDDAIKANNDSLAKYQQAVNGATTADEKAKAEQELLNAQTKTLAENHKLLNDSVYKLTEQGKSLTEQRKQDLDVANKLAKQHDDLANKILNAGHATQEQSVRLKNLQADYEAAKQKVNDDNNAVNANTAALDKNKAALDANNKARQEQKNLLAGMQVSYDEALQKMQHEDTEFTQTLGMNTKQLYDYYQQQYDADFAIWKHYVDTKQVYQAQKAYPQMMADLQKFNEEKKKLYSEDEQNQKKAFDTMSKDLSTFLDDFIVQHKSLKDSLKGIYDQILKAFEEMIAQMIIKALFFKNVAGSALGLGGAGGFLSFLGFGGGGGSSAASVASSATSAASTVELGPNSVKALTGSTTGVDPFAPGGAFVGSSGAVTALGALAIGAGAWGIGSGIGNLISGGGPGNTHGTWGGLGALAGVGTVGLLAGGAAAALGGAGGLMGGLGLLAGAGPVGWGILAGGAILGGLAGGLFGHKDNPANMPDKYDTQNYGTIVADLMGHAGANGQNFTEQSQLSQLSGGKTGIAFVEETLAKYGSKDKAPDWLKPMWDQLVAQFGISATGSGQLNFGHAINNQWITGAAGVDGKTYQYTDLGNSLSDFSKAYAQAQQNPQASNGPIFSVDRMAPDFNAARVSAWTANTRTPGGTTGHIGDIISHVIDGLKSNQPIIINNPQIYGSHGIDEFANKMQQIIERNRSHNYRNGGYTDY